MELTRLEKAEPDAKGAVAVEATASAAAVHGLLAEFYETVAAAKGLAPDRPWDDVEAAAQAGMGAEAFCELRRDFVVNRMACWPTRSTARSFPWSCRWWSSRASLSPLTSRWG